MLPRLTQVAAKDNYLLNLLFNNGEKENSRYKTRIGRIYDPFGLI